MPDLPQTIRATTQSNLDLEDIVEDLVILKDGSASLIMQASSINFDLLSEMEQEATIYAYAATLNSLTYPIQILIHSERKDISDYIRVIKMYEDRQSSKILKDQIRKYRRFIEETVERNNVLDKKYYIIIPFTRLELGVSKAIGGSFNSKKGLPYDIKYIVKQAKDHLLPKRDHLIRQFVRLGINLRQLTTAELIEFFYNIYNPDSKGQKLAPTQSYTTPIVQGPANITQKLAQKVAEINNQADIKSPSGSVSPAPVASPEKPVTSASTVNQQTQTPQSNYSNS